MLAFRSAFRTAPQFNKTTPFVSAVATTVGSGYNNARCICVGAQPKDLSRFCRQSNDQYAFVCNSRRLLTSSGNSHHPRQVSSMTTAQGDSSSSSSSSSSGMDSGWLQTPTTDSQKARELYNGWADNIDDFIHDCNYQCPPKVAKMMKDASPVIKMDDLILDAGCGTGLTGKALKDVGFTNIHGIDISSESLAVASKTKAYQRLMPIDMQELPLSFDGNSFQAAQCVGVLAYIADAESLMREFCRVVQPGGTIIFTQRDDLFVKRDFEGFMQRLQDEGLWERLAVSEPELYLPASEIYSDKIKVVYCTMRVKA